MVKVKKINNRWCGWGCGGVNCLIFLEGVLEVFFKIRNRVILLIEEKVGVGI